MNRWVLGIILVVVVLGAGSWGVLSFRAKAKYDQTRKELLIVYPVTAMDQQRKTFLADVQSNWTCKADSVGGPNSEMVKLAGMTPSVQNLIHVFNYQMPEYAWFSPAQNRNAAMIGLLKAKFFPTSVDKQWHISDNEHLVMLWANKNIVFVYRDEPSGMRETMYVRNTTSNQASQAIGAEAAPQPER